MKTMSKIMTALLIAALCVSLFTVQAYAAEGSSPVTHVPAVAATCTEKGMAEYWLAADGDVYLSNPGDPVSDISSYTGSMPETEALGHNLTVVEAKDATCMAEGNSAYWYCSRCNKLFSDAAGTTETTLDAVKIPKTNHKGLDASKHAKVDATCGDDGTLEYYICQWCGQPIASTEASSTMSSIIIPATGAHSFGAWTDVSAATATKGGVQKRVCTVCGLEEYQTTDPAGIPAADDELYAIIAERDTYYRGEELPQFWSELIGKLNKAGGGKVNNVGVRFGTNRSMYANSYDTLDFWSSGNTITLGEKMLRDIDAGVYYLWVYNKNNPNEHTNSIPFYIVDVPTLEAINTDKHVVNSTKNLRFRASEPIMPGSVKVGGKSLLDPNYYYVSNDGLTITLSPDFLNERQAGNYNISANTVADGTKVSCPFYILSTASASASPKTGDESQLGLWAAFLLLSGAAIVVLVPKIRKHGV